MELTFRETACHLGSTRLVPSIRVIVATSWRVSSWWIPCLWVSTNCVVSVMSGYHNLQVLDNVHMYFLYQIFSCYLLLDVLAWVSLWFLPFRHVHLFSKPSCWSWVQLNLVEISQHQHWILIARQSCFNVVIDDVYKLFDDDYLTLQQDNTLCFLSFTPFLSFSNDFKYAFLDNLNQLLIVKLLQHINKICKQ